MKMQKNKKPFGVAQGRPVSGLKMTRSW